LIGIDVAKEDDLGEWYQQVITKGQMISYYDVCLPIFTINKLLTDYNRRLPAGKNIMIQKFTYILMINKLYSRAFFIRNLGIHQSLVRQPDQDTQSPQRILSHLHQRRQSGERERAR
jgi:hypothetical protein